MVNFANAANSAENTAWQSPVTRTDPFVPNRMSPNYESKLCLAAAVLDPGAAPPPNPRSLGGGGSPFFASRQQLLSLTAAALHLAGRRPVRLRHAQPDSPRPAAAACFAQRHEPAPVSRPARRISLPSWPAVVLQLARRQPAPRYAACGPLSQPGSGEPPGDFARQRLIRVGPDVG